MAARVSKWQVGEYMVGRILSFDRIKGYGFIHTSDKKDILFSSYNVPKGIWKKISVGDYIEFIVDRSDNGDESIVAKNLVIIKKMPRHLAISLPNGEKLEVRHIYKYGRGSMFKDYKDLYPGYSSKNFDYVFIETHKKSLIFNRENSPISVDGKTDIEKFYMDLIDLLAKYNIDRDYESLSF